MATNSITTLDSIYTSLINYQIQVESAPLTRLTTQKTALETQRAVYADLKTKLDQFRTSTKALLSSDPFYSLKSGRQVSVVPGITGSTVVSASVSSSAVAASYKIEEIVLAKNDRIKSDAQEYADQALSKQGTFYIGGLETSTAEKISETLNTITNFGANSVETGQLELGTGQYFVETRKNSSDQWQFRLVDSEGYAANIKNGANYSSDWQSIPTGGGTYSTGRGLTIDFGTDSEQYLTKTKLTGAAALNYSAKGAAITVTEDMSLIDIASAINSGTYAKGNELTATVVNKQLVVNSTLTGSTHKIKGSGTILQELGVFKEENIMQAASDSSFKINGLLVSRSQNSSLTDVISGVTLNLAADGEGKTATLTIVSDNASAKNAINSFITNFNSLQTYLRGKLSVTKNAEGKYTRGSLTGDQALVSLKNDLFNKFGSYDATSGLYKSMRDIGIDFSSSMNLAITNNSKLEEALKNNYSEVAKLFDRVIGSIDSKVDKYIGRSNSYIEQLIKSNDSQTKSTTDQITSWNSRLAKRKELLTNQYVETQAQMALLTNTQATNTAWINNLNLFR